MTLFLKNNVCVHWSRMFYKSLNFKYVSNSQFLKCYLIRSVSRYNLKIEFESNVCNRSERYFTSINSKYYKEEILSDARKLRKHLQCTIQDAERIIRDNRLIFQDGVSNVIDTCKLCERLGISKEIISSHFWIVSLGKGELIEKLNLLTKLQLRNIASGIYLLKFDKKKLSFTISSLVNEGSKVPELKNSNRIAYLSSVLQKEEIIITELVYKRQFLLRMNFIKLRDSLQLILSYGMSPDHLCNDIWPVRFNLEEVKQRLEILRTSIEPSELRPWMLRCGEATFRRTLELRDENRIALVPFSSASEYLGNRLEVDGDMIEILKQKHPPLCRVQVHKLKGILDFLFAEGFSATQVCAAPRVLCHSLFTLKERLKVLQSIGYRPNSLMTLCKTKKQFSEFIGKLEHCDSYKKHEQPNY